MSTRSIDEILADEAEASEAGRDLDANYVRNRRRAKEPSQLYSVRLPVSRLEELRVLAAESHITPAALARRLVIEGLDRQADAVSRIAETRHELGPDADQMIVMTQEQFKEQITEAVRYTTKEVLPSMIAAAVAAVDEIKQRENE